MDKSVLFQQMSEEIEKHWPSLAALSDYMAGHPELSGEEFESSRRLVEILKNAGFEVEYPFMDMPTAFMARKTAQKPGGRVALMAEYDALPEIGHACGHNLHGAMSVLAGLGLLPLMDELGGELIIAGTPAEETSGGKVAMSESGVFDDVDLAMMIHCDCGRSSVKYRSLAMDAIEFTFSGQSSHAAQSPWEGRNALNGLQLFFHSLDMLRQHVRPDVRIHGVYREGGVAPNIVPERAVGCFYFRAASRAYLDKVMGKVWNCATGCALATDTDVTWKPFEASFKDMLPNKEAEELLASIMREEFGLSPDDGDEFQGSSDMGDVSYRCPALQMKLDISDGRKIRPHSREFAEATTTEAAHQALKLGAKILGRGALAVFTDEKLRERLVREFEKRAANIE